MIEQNQKKVKGIIRRVLNFMLKGVSVPQYKYSMEMVTGLLSSKSLNLTEIGRALKEEISIKQTEKRLQRNTSSYGLILDTANNGSLRASSKAIREDSYIYADGGDITYSQATSYTEMSPVRDGSSGKIKLGYLLNMAVYKDEWGEVTPLYLDVFHRCADYGSDNAETYKMLDKTMEIIGSKGIWTMDRGYDNKQIMRFIYERGSNFLIRLKTNRQLGVCGERKSVRDIARSITLRYEFSNGRYGYKKCYLEDMPVTLIYYTCGHTKLMLLHSGHIRKHLKAEKAIIGYLNRWGIEEGYKFIKQAFGLERARVMRYEGIRTLVGVVLLAWQVSKAVSEDKEVKIITEQASRKIDKVTVKFCFYRIVNGISYIFSLCKELYRFRRKRRTSGYSYTIEDFLPVNRIDRCWNY